jgi:hypothetical protein
MPRTLDQRTPRGGSPSVPATQNPLWEAHLASLRRIHGATASAAEPASHAPAHRSASTDLDAERARSGEWNANPPGRLGRLLLPDVERYLEFFAIARDA